MGNYSILTLICIIALVLTAGCSVFGSGSQKDQGTPPATSLQTTIATTVPMPTTVVTTPPATPTPGPFPNALNIKEPYPYGSNKSISEATLYRFWINDTYQLFDPKETIYATKKPGIGKKYLILFLNVVNRGTDRSIPPGTSGISVWYDGTLYYPDPTHTVPRTAKTTDSPPVILRIGEIEFFHKLYGSEYVEDFGYSHGNELAYLTPGESNAIDGYIIFEVPSSLTPDKTYVQVALSPQNLAIWKLG
jgi:hypothetical protein